MSFFVKLLSSFKYASRECRGKLLEKAIAEFEFVQKPTDFQALKSSFGHCGVKSVCFPLAVKPNTFIYILSTCTLHLCWLKPAVESLKTVLFLVGTKKAQPSAILPM